MRQGKLGLKVGSINIDATRCMPDKERGGSKNVVSVFLDVKERRGRRRRIEKRKEKDETNRKHVMYKGKKGKEG